MVETRVPPPTAIEAIAPGEVDKDEFTTTSDFDSTSLLESTTSQTSSVYHHSFENGRRYHQYRYGRYPIPNDDAEQNRDNMKHAMLLELTDGKLFFADIGDNPRKIIDLGTGTGIWAVDVADKYPSARVVGIDLSPIQPVWVPPNLQFVVDDIEDDWLHGDDYDLVHMRCIAPWIKNLAKVLKSCFDHIKPGGWIEIQEFDARAHCDDGTLPEDAPLRKFFEMAALAVAKFGMNFNAGEILREPLEQAGFVNVSCVTKKIPIGTWPKNNTLRLVGQYCKTAVNDMFGAMAAKPFRALDIDLAEIEMLLDAARKDINNTAIHSYEHFFFWTGQKPVSP